MTRRILTILLAAAILAAAVPVYADGGADAGAQLEADLAAIMSEHGLDEGNIAFGYRRTTDWTQFTFNEDALFESASVYKLALNMYYYEQEAAGNIAPDAVYGGMPLSDCHRLSLQYSNNDLSRVMLDAAFPDFADYKRLAAGYAGIDVRALDEEYLYSSEFNVNIQLGVLQRLYDGADSTYAEAIGYLKAAQPGEYFKSGVTEYEIAQKYGYDTYGGSLYVATVGIVFAEEPFLIAVFTRSVPGAGNVIGEICRAFCDYNDAPHDPLPEPEAPPVACTSPVTPEVPLTARREELAAAVAGAAAALSLLPAAGEALIASVQAPGTTS